MADINIIYKEVEQLSQKSTISGSEKIVVSDTEFVTPNQIAGLADVSGKQDTLVSGVNIKTINHLSLLGSGNITIEGGGGGGGGTVEWGNIGGTLADQNDLATALASKADVSDIPSVPAISTDIEIDQNSNTKTASPKAIHDITGSLSNLTTSNKSSLVAAINEVLAGGGGSSDNPLVDISVPTPYDGTVIFTYKNGDTTTIDLNHQHPQYPRYTLLADDAAYAAIVTKESDMLYLIPETE